MNTYIQKDTTTIYVELDYLLDDNYTIGTTWDDYKDGLWVLLSDEQVAFRKANPKASVQEVFNMELIPVPEPTPEELLEKARNQRISDAGDVYQNKINDFKYNDTALYIDYYQRLIKKDEASLIKQNGGTSIVLGSIEVNVDYTDYILNALTTYEKECGDALNEILSKLHACTSIDEVNATPITEGYPESPNLTEQDILASEAKAVANVPELQIMSFAKMAVNTMNFTDEQALSVKLLHPEWEEFIGGTLSVGTRVLYEGRLYKVRQEVNPVLATQPPSIATAALYEEINEEHAGTKDDPIPYNNNMTLELGKYYTQNNVLYLCFRDSQQAVYNDLKDLVGIYVEIVE